MIFLFERLLRREAYLIFKAIPLQLLELEL